MSEATHDHNFAPDFAWSLAAGVVVAAVVALLYTLVVTWGGFPLDGATADGTTVPLGAHMKELIGLGLAGALAVLVARGINMQTS
jgi:hypothetical protein